MFCAAHSYGLFLSKVQDFLEQSQDKGQSESSLGLQQIGMEAFAQDRTVEVDQGWTRTQHL